MIGYLELLVTQCILFTPLTFEVLRVDCIHDDLSFTGHELKECQGLAREKSGAVSVANILTLFIPIRVATVREKILKNEKFSRSGKSQRSSILVSEIKKK